ncbi:MAG: preprotein translocase subunit SecE [Candidatus Kerfeldbacteria bacterium CG08_land_8_20_14_0_20_43_14]|uniref:Protein translocase subunit SecE n=1 Tax=Candidatus Kerfeldbacteria bacterium CG08_land_8_20_14_0_20_43_14 TaxID=2014246 RepID=A0A2H0YRT2_9BACT|nr:MAG: preprotein translocase subunit SecE [Candidatus Kerfeldbacteria bacterium CG08_land_8_20_14_0_20_43_14]
MANWLTNYFKESYEELKKVSWPTRKDTVRDTLVVIGVSLAVALFLGLLDIGLAFGLEKLIQR